MLVSGVNLRQLGEVALATTSNGSPTATKIMAIGRANDPFLAALARSAESRCSVSFLHERNVFTTTRFALHIRGATDDPQITVDGSDAGALAGVVVRPTRGAFWHSHARLEDRQFVHHEAVAAWLAVLDALPCPVVNRYPISWWLLDSAEDARLDASMALALGRGGETAAGETAYIAGRAIVPGSVSAAPLADLLSERRDAIQAWQAEHGIILCRIDVTPAARFVVDVAPQFEDVEPDLTGRVARGVLEELL